MVQGPFIHFKARENAFITKNVYFTKLKRMYILNKNY